MRGANTFPLRNRHPYLSLGCETIRFSLSGLPSVLLSLFGINNTGGDSVVQRFIFPPSFALVLGLKNPGSDSWRLCWGNVIDLCWSIPKHVSPSFVCFLCMGLFAYLLCVYMFMFAMCLHCSCLFHPVACIFIAFHISLCCLYWDSSVCRYWEFGSSHFEVKGPLPRPVKT